MSIEVKIRAFFASLLAISVLAFIAAARTYGQNSKVMGEIEFTAATEAERHSGIWIDGQYVGYLDELKGDRRVLLLPGQHEIVGRESGYKDFTQTVVIEPGQKREVRVSLVKDPAIRPPALTAEVKLDVSPGRAAVFVDEGYLGPVRDFGGTGRAMLISPGKHRIKIALPGYQTFDTEINLRPGQKYTLKTELAKGSITQAEPEIKKP